MNLGKGIQREWHDNGRLKIEVSTVNGLFCGRSRIWLRDGTLIAERFYLGNRQVSGRQYLIAASKDSSLPRYREKLARLPKKNRALERRIQENLIAALGARSDCREARSWFAATGRSKHRRLLGRFPSERSAVKFIESLYAQGAARVIAPGIYRDKRGNEYADGLVIRLPRSAVLRSRIRQVCAALRRGSLGSIEPASDIGETHLYLSME